MVELNPANRVLIIDDEQVIADTLVTIFSQRGYEARGAYSAEQALSMMESWKPGLVIADVLLPAMNGIDLAIRIKSQWPECHISLFSGQAATSDLLDGAMRNGHFFNVHAKPIHPSELLGVAARVLQGPTHVVSTEN